MPPDRIGDLPEDAWFERQAQFCLATGVQPSEYERMTDRQIAIWIRIHNKNSKQK